MLNHQVLCPKCRMNIIFVSYLVSCSVRSCSLCFTLTLVTAGDWTTNVTS